MTDPAAGTVSSIVKFLSQFKAFLVLSMIAGSSGFLVFANNRILDFFGLTAIVQKWRGAFSLVFIASGILFALCVADFVNRTAIAKWKAKRRIENRIKNCNRNEAIVLAKIAESGNSAIWFNPLHAGINTLVADGILRLVSGNPAMKYLKCAYGPTPLAAPYLRRKRLAKLLKASFKRLNSN